MQRRALAATVIFIAGAAALGATLGAYGAASDEPNYLHAADLEVRWASQWLGTGQVDGRSAFDPEVLHRYWDSNPLRIPHPPLSRELSAVAATLAPAGVRPLVAHRLHLAVLGGLMLVVAFLWLDEWLGRPSAWAGVVALIAMPQLVGHAHVGLTDFPLAFFWLAALAAAAATRIAPLRRGALTGLLVGCALATKLPGAFLAVVIAGWILWVRRTGGLRELVVVAVVAAVVAIALNPNGWVDPVEKLRTWLRLSTTRKDFHAIRSFYFGKTYAFHPPWHYPWVQLFATTPLGLFGLAVAGLTSGLRGTGLDRDNTLLAGAGALILPAVLTWPGSPCHDGVRLFLPTLPLVAVLAVRGHAAIVAWLGARARHGGATDAEAIRRKLAWAVGAVGLGPGLIATVLTHPYSMAYYGAGVGGVRGADRLGLETTYLKEVMTPGFIAALDRSIPPHSVVLTGFTYEELAFDQETGDLDPSFRLSDFPPADFLVMVHRKSELSEFGWKVRREVTPVYEVKLDGVPLASLYRVAREEPPASVDGASPGG